MIAKGTFDVSTTPLSNANSLPPSIVRFMLDKHYHGDLEGDSKGEMLGAGDLAKGTAGYVAIEMFEGTVLGRKGSCAFQHLGSMDEGAMQLGVSIVPGSGTDELAGIRGTLTITIDDGKHTYDLDFTLPGA